MDGDQASLQRLWHAARDGNLTPWTQAKAWALREVWRDNAKTDSEYGLCTYVASKIVKKGGGHPTDAAVRKLFEKMDGDADWYPGKTYGSAGGRPCAISGTNKAVIARSIMALKESGAEPTYGLAIAQCPNAAVNPDTGAPVTKKRIYDIMRSHCYDEDPDLPWTNRPRLSKTMLTAEDEERRLAWGHYIQGLRHTPAWYIKRVVWTDICNSVLPRSVRKTAQQAQARKGGRGWMSEGSQMKSLNLRGPKESVKQNSWDTVRLWWAPLVLRGKVHVEILGTDFPGECPAGMRVFVSKVRAAINRRCQGEDQPDVLFVDRGKGFYHSSTGVITPEFKAALADHDLRAFMRDNASEQPGSLQEVMLHETAVAWIRDRQTKTTPKKPWEETVEAHGERLRDIATYINGHYDVDGLHRDFLPRVQTLIDAEGGRLRK